MNPVSWITFAESELEALKDVPIANEMKKIIDRIFMIVQIIGMDHTVQPVNSLELTLNSPNFTAE